MSFTVVGPRDDHELEDAVRRGVADGLARMLGVPKHPVGVQAFLDKNAHESDEGSEGRSEPTRHLSKAAAEV
ncbi:hypothetical protein [Methylobacterium sp. E-065]|uniref:hypothetical protein n=1 Tax=Methylobacterium sp. E-065 TaxID=2836583 RepID=UPI001FB95A9F|nr:hypothetical protein [Methylobacterium sp. E-065]